MRSATLGFMTFPRAHWTQIYSTNPLERLNAEFKLQDFVGWNHSLLLTRECFKASEAAASRRLIAVIEALCPTRGRVGRQPISAPRMLRMYFCSSGTGSCLRRVLGRLSFLNLRSSNRSAGRASETS